MKRVLAAVLVLGISSCEAPHGPGTRTDTRKGRRLQEPGAGTNAISRGDGTAKAQPQGAFAGHTWEILSGTGGGVITAFCVADNGTAWLATSDGSLLLSRDGGDLWESVRMVADVRSNDVIKGLDCSAMTNGQVLAWADTRQGRLLHARDGKSWKATPSFCNYVSSVQVLDEMTAVARRGGAFWWTEDAGATWQPHPGIPDATESSPSRTQSDRIHVFSHFSDRLQGVMLSEDFCVETTSDGGRTWKTTSGPIQDDDERILSIILDRKAVRICRGNKTLYQHGSLSVGDETVRQLLSCEAKRNVIGEVDRTFRIVSSNSVFLCEPYRLRWTGDGGRTWKRKFVPTVFSSIFFVDSEYGWAVSREGRISRTQDGGDSWMYSCLPADANPQTVYFVDRKTGWLGGCTNAPAIWYTRDGGVVWEESSAIRNGREGQHGIPETVQDMVFHDRFRGWAVTHGMTMNPSKDWRERGDSPREYGRVLRTEDGGRTWHSVYYGMPLKAIARRLNILTAVGYGIVRSEDGIAWKETTVKDPLFAVAFADDRRVVTVGERAHYSTSQDSAKTWQRVVVAGIPEGTHLDAVGFGSTTIGWIGGDFTAYGPMPGHSMGMGGGMGTEEHAGLFYTTNGGQSWAACMIPGVYSGGCGEGWRDLAVVDTSHAWAVCGESVARVKRTPSRREKDKNE